MAIQQGPVATPLCCLWGERARSVSTGQGVATWRAKHSWRTHYKGETHGEVSKEFILEASGQAYRRGGDWLTTAMQHPWERVGGAKPPSPEWPLPGISRNPELFYQKSTWMR